MTRLKIIVGCICLLVGVVSFALAQNPPSLITLSASKDMIQPGDEFSLTIHIQDAVGVYGSSVKLAYDPQVLEVVLNGDQAVVSGEFFGDRPGFPLKNGVDSVNGIIEYVLSLRQPAEPVTGNGVLGTVHFRTLGAGPIVVDVIEARLLAPVFEDVNGVKIAQRVDELPVSVQNLMIDVGSGNTDVVAIVPTTAAQPVSLPGITQSQATISITVPSRWLIIAAGTLFFMIGLALFTFSLGSYVKLRRQYSH